MSIELTAVAAGEIRQLVSELADGGDGPCLRVGVKGLGPQRNYTLELTEPDERHPVVGESQGIRISCRDEDRAALEGVTIDLRDLGAARGFVFQSPSHQTRAAGRKTDI